MVHELAQTVGAAGLIGGQAADVAGETRPPQRDLVAYIHANKTARLLQAACRLGALIADDHGGAVEAVGAFGHHFGLAFQATDDLLDVTATSAAMGKAVGKDTAAGKQTYVRCLGAEQARRLAVEQVDRAIAALAPFSDRAEDLRQLARYLLERRR